MTLAMLPDRCNLSIDKLDHGVKTVIKLLKTTQKLFT